MNQASALKAWAVDLKRSGLTMAEAKKRGMKLLAPATTRSMTKTAKYAGAYVWSYLIPYFDVKGKKTKYWRIRYLEDVLGPFGARPKKPRRYTGPKGAKIRAYFDPTVDYSTVRKGK